MQININDSLSYSKIDKEDILKTDLVPNKDESGVEKLTEDVDLNSAFRIDIKKAYQDPENRISDKVRELFDEIVNGVNKTSGSYYIMESFKDYTEDYSLQKKEDPAQVSNTVSEIHKKMGLDLDDDTDKIVTVGAEPEEVIKREQDLKSDMVREKEIVRQIKKQFIDEVTPGVENYLKDIEDKSKGIIEDMSALYEKSGKLQVDYKKESENFTKDSLKEFSGDLKKAQAVKQVDLGIEYI